MIEHHDDIEFDDLADSEIDGSDEYELDELIFPYAPPQQWVVLHSGVNRDELSVYTFLMAHLNPYTGKFETFPGRRRIAERFGMSLDWVDKQLKGLAQKGALTKKWTYWRDAFDHSKGRSVNAKDSDGTKRAQAPNRYRVHLKPAERERYTGPIKISEYYRPDKIRERVEKYGGQMPTTDSDSDTDSGDHESPGERGAATQRPGSDQGTRGSSSPRGGRHTAARGGPPHSGPGGRHTAAQKNTGGKTTGTTKTTPEPFGKTQKVPDLQKVYRETAGHSAYGVTEQGDRVGDPLPARARTNAGQLACQAIDGNSLTSADELVSLIRQEHPHLTRSEAFARAADLLAATEADSNASGAAQSA